MNLEMHDYRGEGFALSVAELIEYVNSEAFVAFYDAAAVKHDNLMQPLDWAVSTLLQAPIRRYSPLQDLFASSSAQWAACNAALTSLGKDVPLENDAALKKRDEVEACFEAFMRPSGIGASIATKTLHKKRPQLVPVIDDYVATVLAGRRGASLGHSGVARIIYDNFRPQLLANIDPIDKVLAGLREITLTRCRVLDIAIWVYADRNRVAYGLRKD